MRKNKCTCSQAIKALTALMGRVSLSVGPEQGLDCFIYPLQS